MKNAKNNVLQKIVVHIFRALRLCFVKRAISWLLIAVFFSFFTATLAHCLVTFFTPFSFPQRLPSQQSYFASCIRNRRLLKHKSGKMCFIEVFSGEIKIPTKHPQFWGRKLEMQSTHEEIVMELVYVYIYV